MNDGKMRAAESDVPAKKIRDFLVEKIFRTGGHLGPNLGVVELTIALHRVFESPHDRIIWDTGHQAYVHKILTGRWRKFDQLRQKGGLSGYPSRDESEHDVIENSHASTALSYADGIAKGYQLSGCVNRAVVAVIGDGALTGGIAWEALNNISGARDRPVIIVLNDNGRSYAPTIGGLATHLATLRTGRGDHGPAARGMFEGLGLQYIGPLDGHDITQLESALRRAVHLGQPTVVHCVTQKGRGFAQAEDDTADCLHAVPAGGFPAVKTAGQAPLSWTSVFGQELLKIDAERPEVVAITAAMLEPTGLAGFARAFPEGAMAGTCLEAAELLAAEGVQCDVADPRWLIPDSAGLIELPERYRLVVTVEDNVRSGGFGTQLSLALAGALVTVPTLCLGLPKRFLAHGKRGQILEECGLTGSAVARSIAMRFIGLSNPAESSYMEAGA